MFPELPVYATNRKSSNFAILNIPSGSFQFIISFQACNTPSAAKNLNLQRFLAAI